MARYLLPWLVRRYMNKVRNQFYQRQGWAETKDPNLKVNIKHQKEAKSSPKTSEYIDFEEIK